MALINTKGPAPSLRIITDDDRLVILRPTVDGLRLHIEALHDDDHEIQAKLRPDQVARLVEALNK